MNIKEILEDLQKNKPQRAWHHTLKKLPEFWEATKELPEDFTVAERAYYILHDLTLENIKCKNCKTNLTRLCNKFEDGFRDFCSVKCSRTFPGTKEKQEKTCEKKYGVKNPRQSKEIAAKVEATNLKKYGSKTPLRKKEIVHQGFPDFKALYDLCLSAPFPGTNKWPAEHPIWDCWIAGHISPKKAWSMPEMLQKAVNNLEYIWLKGIKENKYEDYLKRWTEEINAGSKSAAKVVLDRFTVAKIAPKVTALSETNFKKLLKESGKDFSKGIYCPMAGFGGIVRAALSLKVPVEAYDINENLNAWYGWTYRNALAQVITTDKIVAACPPFGTKTERWPGTPDDMYYSFEDWCELLRKYIIAPDYVFIGPELKSKNKCGLFGKSTGVQLYK